MWSAAAQQWYDMGYWDAQQGRPQRDVFTSDEARRAYQLGYSDRQADRPRQVLPVGSPGPVAPAAEGAVNAVLIVIAVYHLGYAGKPLQPFIDRVRAQTRIEVTATWIRDVTSYYNQGAADKAAGKPDQYAGHKGLWEEDQPGLAGDAGKPPEQPPPPAPPPRRPRRFEDEPGGLSGLLPPLVAGGLAWYLQSRAERTPEEEVPTDAPPVPPASSAPPVPPAAVPSAPPAQASSSGAALVICGVAVVGLAGVLIAVAVRRRNKRRRAR